MQVGEVAAAAGVVLRGDPAIEITGVSFDSRRVATGDLFCCVPGAAVDGHDYASAAVHSGAAALLVERDVGAAAQGVPVLRTPSVRHSMGQVAAAVYGRPSAALRVTGITGTNGKTSTAWMLTQVLEAAGHTVGLTGTIETRIAGASEPVLHTTPEAPDVHRLLRRMVDSGCDHAVMEVSSHALDQDRVGGVRFAVAAFTNLSQDHLDYHGSMDAYFEAKRRLFDPARTEVAVVNTGDVRGAEVAGAWAAPGLITYAAGPSGTADVTAELRVAAVSSLHVSLTCPETDPVDVEVAVAGLYNVANIACVSACALALGVDAAALPQLLTAVGPVPGRFEPVDGGQPFAVIVDYAHTPDGVDSVLRSARPLVAAGASLRVVLGCGGDRDRTKRPLMGAAAGRLADHVIVTSDNPRSEDPGAIIAEILPGLEGTSATVDVEVDRAEAIRAAVAGAQPGDVVVIAGKGHETGQEIAGVLHPFDDRLVAGDALRALSGGRG